MSFIHSYIYINQFVSDMIFFNVYVLGKLDGIGGEKMGSVGIYRRSGLREEGDGD